jgi:type I restriction enzyme S subunit
MMGTLHQTKAIGELCSFSSGHGFTPRDWAKSGLPIIRIAHLNGSRRFDYFPGEPDPRWIVEPGELLFAWAGTRGVSFGPTIWDGPRGVLNQHIYRVRPNSEVDQTWLYYVLVQVTNRIEKRAHGFKSTLLHVRKKEIENQRWRVPSLASQQAVVDVLGLAECATKKLDMVVESKRIFQRGLMQQLLTGRRRFPEFRERPWHSSALENHVTLVTRRNAVGSQLVLTASGEHGLVDQRRYFNRRVAGKDLSKYYLLKAGEFAYNRSAMIGYPFGATKRLEQHQEGALSTLYLCFAVSDSKLDSDYLTYVFESGVLNRQLRPIARIGARAHGLLNVTDDDFLSISIPLPELDEQRRIAGLLNTTERELNLVTTKRALIEREKRVLQSTLLSGDIVV